MINAQIPLLPLGVALSSTSSTSPSDNGVSSSSTSSTSGSSVVAPSSVVLAPGVVGVVGVVVPPPSGVGVGVTGIALNNALNVVFPVISYPATGVLPCHAKLF